MDFNEAEQKRIQFSTRLQSGQLTPAQFAQALTGLQVTDARGTIWQPNPSGNGWIFWTGSAWQPGAPPGIPGPGTSTGTSPPQRSKDFNDFKSSLMSVDEFKKISKDVPLAKRPQPWWDLLSILGGIVAAVFWLLYSGIREGFDFLTPVLMIAIPVILVWFRGNIDNLLLPLQPYRQKISKILLIGIGIAFPFLTSFVLYSLGIREYPLIQWNMIIGTFGAYAITRTPALGLSGNGKPKGGPLPTGGFIVIVIAAICSFLILPVRADDCTRDILNANDCLRTDGYAEVISGGFSTLVSILINGPTILQTLIYIGPGIQPPMPPTPPTPPSPQSPQPPQTPGDTSGPYHDTPEEKKQIEDALNQMKQQKQKMLDDEAARVKAIKDKMLGNLKHMENGMIDGPFGSKFTSDDFGRINGQIQKVIGQLETGGKVDTNLYNKIFSVYEGRVTGRTIPANEMISDAQINRDTIKGGLEGTASEIFTGRDADGNFSGKALGLRVLVGVATGGSSELVATPVSSVYTMKDYVDGGGTSAVGAFFHSLKDVAIGEGIGLAGKGLGILGGKLLSNLANELPTSISGPVSEGIQNIKNVLNTEIRNPFAGETPSVSGGTVPHLKTTSDITDDILNARRTGNDSPGLKDSSIVPTDAPANTDGFTTHDQKVIRVVADQNGVDIHFKASNPDGALKLSSGEANPKPCDLKVTTVSDADLPLGHSADNKGLVVFKQPEPPVRTPGMSDADFNAASNRYDYRLKEFNDQAPAVNDLVSQGKIKVDPDNGLITSTANNKPFATDNDLFGVKDAVTGKPVSPATVAKVTQDLKANGVIQHGGHLDWNYANTPSSDMGKVTGIDIKGLMSAKLGNPGATPLNTYRPLQNNWGTSMYNGDTSRNFVSGSLGGI
jgi:hypothetical protein